MLKADEKEAGDIRMTAPRLAVSYDGSEEFLLSRGVLGSVAWKEMIGIFGVLVTNWALVGVKVVEMVLLSVQR